MARYEQNDLAFDVPRDWDDRSVIAFTAPVKPGRVTSPNFVVTREAMSATETLASLADRQFIELARRLDGFDLHSRSELTIAELPAIEVRFSWSGQGGAIVQRVIMIARKRTMLTFTATAPKAEAATINGMFDRIVASIHFPDAALEPG